MQIECYPAFIEEFIKIAGAMEKAQTKVETHHKGMDLGWYGSAPKTDWKAFQKSLSSKNFQKAVIENSKSDDKLKSYAKNVGEYILSKEVVGKEPSRTSKKMYTIRKLSDGRLGCGCKDWRYVHSVNGTDCTHIKQLKAKKEVRIKKANMVLDANRQRLLRGEPLLALYLVGKT